MQCKILPLSFGRIYIEIEGTPVHSGIIEGTVHGTYNKLTLSNLLHFREIVLRSPSKNFF
jgi:hypothetical protein